MNSKLVKTLCISLLASLASCSLNNEDLSKAKSHLSLKEYPEAINILKQDPGNNKNKKILTQAYIDYGISLIRAKTDNKDDNHYELAKEQFQNVLKLDPKNKTANDLYQMIIKMQVLESSKS